MGQKVFVFRIIRVDEKTNIGFEFVVKNQENDINDDILAIVR